MPIGMGLMQPGRPDTRSKVSNGPVVSNAKPKEE